MLSGCHHLPGCNLSSLQISWRRKKALSFPSMNTHLIKSCIWFSFRKSPGDHMPSYYVNVILFYPSALFIYFCFPLLISPSPSFFHLTAVQMTCCRSSLLWLCGASVPSWCLNALLWRNSFMKGESSWWKKMVNDHPLCLNQIHITFWRNGYLHNTTRGLQVALYLEWTCLKLTW